ncbi:MAG: S-layer homology domain-containing protein [Limnothrix sp.]
MRDLSVLKMLAWFGQGTEKIGSLLIAMSMVTVMMPVSAQRSPTNLQDVNGHWAQLCIQHLHQRKIVTGYPDQTFRPNEPVTRTEFAAMLNRAFSEQPTLRSQREYVDLDETYWGLIPIYRATQTGFMEGYPDGSFAPTKNIPRYEVLLALVSGLSYSPQGDPQSIIPQYYEDANLLPKFAYPAIAAATEQQLVVNYPNVKQLQPKQWASRAEVASFLCRALKTTGTVPAKYVAGDSTLIPKTGDRPTTLPSIEGR